MSVKFYPKTGNTTTRCRPHRKITIGYWMTIVLCKIGKMDEIIKSQLVYKDEDNLIHFVQIYPNTRLA